jgi:hypothetical protein
MNLGPITCELRRSRFIAEAGRFVGERRAVHATKLQRFVSLNAITLGTAFHDY